jgi:HAD superfamily hydrolase (TIGR01509 family)
MAEAFDLVIFDCDGVLVDSERIAVRVEAEYLAELGWPLSQAEIVERFMGRTAEYMDEAIEARLGSRLPGDWKDQFQRRYLEAFAADLVPVHGVVEALDQISVPTCVASSGSHDKLRLTLGHTGLYGRFEGRIFSGYEVANGKPAPDLFLHAARQMGFEPATTAVVEDSPAGVRAGTAAGMRVLGYAPTAADASALRAEGAEPFQDMAKLPIILGVRPR